jgi:hypothetical protein
MQQDHRRSLTVLLWLAAICGLVGPATAGTPADTRDAILKKEMRYVRASTEYLGVFIGREHPDAKLLVISRATAAGNLRHAALMDGLRAGLANNASICATATPSAFDQDAGNGQQKPAATPYTAAVFDAIVAAHPECNMVVSLIGLPTELAAMRFWHLEKARPRLVVAFGSVYELRKAIQAGFVSAALTYSPVYTPQPNQPAPADYRAALEQRYLLISAKNIEAVTEQFPGMFRE